MLPEESQLDIYGQMKDLLREFPSIQQIPELGLQYLLKDLLPHMHGVYSNGLDGRRIIEASNIPIEIVENKIMYIT